MLKDLDDMSGMIKGNNDVKEMHSLIKDTSSSFDENGKAFEKLRKKIEGINKDADKVMRNVDFYPPESDSEDSDPELA